MIKRTFKEWNEAGYRIIKGEKSHSRNEAGVPLFTERQVRKREYINLSDSDDTDFGHALGLDWHD